MNEVIDVEYTEITDLSEKSTEELAAEANTLWNQMEAIGNLGLMMAAQAGQRLNVIKSRLAHGQWEDWCKNNLKFSLVKANRMMKLAEKISEETSIFSNPSTLKDIGISKVWALLAAPEEVAEEVVKNPELPDMTVKELETEIRRLKEKNQNLTENMEASEEENRQRELQLRKQMEELEAEIQIYKEAPAKSEESEKEIARLQAELDKARAAAEKEKKKAEKEKEESRKLQENLEAEKKKAAEEAAQFAVEKANTKFEEDNRLLIESNRQAAEEIDRLQRLQKNSEDVATFGVISKQMQINFEACLDCTEKMASKNPQLAENMKNALRTVMEQLTARI